MIRRKHVASERLQAASDIHEDESSRFVSSCVGALHIINVSSAVGSLTSNADPAYPYHPMFGPVYPASKAALNAITLAMMVELESTGIKVNLVSPGFTRTNLNGYEGRSLSRRAPARWCVLRCSARTALQVHSRAGKT